MSHQHAEKFVTSEALFFVALDVRFQVLWVWPPVCTISPCHSAIRRGMRLTTHHDAPVANPDSMRVLSATVTRRTRSGDILGPDECVPVEIALKAMTLWAAWQHFEDDRKKSLAVGGPKAPFKPKPIWASSAAEGRQESS